jgi:hypothetical protein
MTANAVLVVAVVALSATLLAVRVAVVMVVGWWMCV